VSDKWLLKDDTREVHAYLLENPHADSTLMGYVPGAQVGFVTDIWSPGGAPLPARPTPPLSAIIAGVKKYGITPTRFAGGHGSVGDYAPLAALEGK
jgi:hypothetical protein